MPAMHIETGVREIATNVARMIVCMWMSCVRRVLYLGTCHHAERASDCTAKIR
jgi:hypothetical protein